MKISSLLSCTLLSTIVFLVGCASTPTRPLGGISAVQGPASTNCKDLTPRRLDLVKEGLDKELYDSNSGFVRGKDYTLTWTPLKVDEGSRALRYWVGGGAGSGIMLVDVKVTDSRGKLVGQDDVDAMKVMGGFGGDFDDACKEAGEEIAKAARKIVSGEK